MWKETTDGFVRIIYGQSKQSWCGYISSFLLFPTYQMYYCPKPTCDYKACMHVAWLDQNNKHAWMLIILINSYKYKADYSMIIADYSAIWLVNCLAINNLWPCYLKPSATKIMAIPRSNAHAMMSVSSAASCSPPIPQMYCFVYTPTFSFNYSEYVDPCYELRQWIAIGLINRHWV